MQLAQEMASEVFGENGRKAFADVWDGQSSADRYYGFSTWYQAGLTGKPLRQVRGPYAGYVNEAQRSAAYDAGQRDAAALAKEKAAADHASHLPDRSVAFPPTRADLRGLRPLRSPSLQSKLPRRQAFSASPYARTAGTKAEFVHDDYVIGLIESGELDIKTVDRMDAAARLLGVRAYMVDDVAESRANGGYSGSDILIAKDASDPVARVFGHELAHRMQELAPEQFRVFQQAAMDNLADSATLAKIDNYRAQGMTIQYEAAMNDVTADYAGQLLEDGRVLDEFIERHRTDRSLLEKLRDVFRSLWQKLTGAERRKAQTAEGKLAAVLDAAAEQADSLSQAAPDSSLREGAEGQGEVKYSIKYDRDNTPYVVVETDILKNVPQSEWARTVIDNLRKKFPDGITVGNNVVKITRKSLGELTHSKYTMQLLRENPQIHSDKLRATDSTDEIIQTAQNWVNESPLHPRSDNIIDFARGTVQIRIGGNDYTADVIVGNRGKDGLLLYDIIELQPTQIQERTKKTGAADIAAPSISEGQHDRQTAPIEDSVPQSGEESNPQYSLKGTTITKSYNQQLKENDAAQREADRRAQETATEEETMDTALQALAEQYRVEADAGEPAARKDSTQLRSLPEPLVQMAMEREAETIAVLAQASQEHSQLVRAQEAEALAPSAKEFGAKGRKALVDAWAGEQSMQDYYAGFALCYQAGLTGKDIAQVRSPYVRTLSDVQRQAAYLAGQWDAAVLARGGAEERGKKLGRGPTTVGEDRGTGTLLDHPMVTPMLDRAKAFLTGQQDGATISAAEDEGTLFSNEADELRGRHIQYEKGPVFDRDRGRIETWKIVNLPQNNLFVQKGLNVPRKEIFRINERITKVKSLMGIADSCHIPIVISHKSDRIAAYNPRTDVIFIDPLFGKSRIPREIQKDYACPDHPLSTLIHEMFHWKNAYEYRQSGGAICDSSTLSAYTIKQREICRKKLLDFGVDLDDASGIARDISRYAGKQFLDNQLEEVLAEYRTKELLERGNLK